MPLYKYNNKLLVVDGKLAVSEDCCCATSTPTPSPSPSPSPSPQPAQPCPDDCSGCDDEITVTISDMSGVSSAMNCGGGDEPCSCFEGAYTLTRDDDCYWSGGGECGNYPFSILLYCNEQTWTLGCGGQCFMNSAFWTAPNITGCPPATGWTFDNSESDCDGGSLVLS